MTSETFGYSDNYLKELSPLRFQARPAVRAAALVWTLYAVVVVVDVFTLGLSLPFTVGFQLALSGAAGVLAGWLHDRGPNRSAQYVRLGAVAGLMIPVFSALAGALLGLIVGFQTLGFGLISGAVSCLCLPVNLVLGTMVGALGGKFFEELWGKGLLIH